MEVDTAESPKKKKKRRRLQKQRLKNQ